MKTIAQRTPAELRFMHMDALLFGDLLQLEEDGQCKLADMVIRNGYVGHNAEVIVDTLQSVHYEYDMEVLRLQPLSQSTSVKAVERWTKQATALLS